MNYTYNRYIVIETITYGQSRNKFNLVNFKLHKLFLKG